MTRTLRGVWARRGTLLPLFLLTAVVVAGVAAVDAFTREAGTSPAVAVPLLLLGLVAVPATGHQLASVRRGEIAIARMRGLTTGPLYAVLALEPLVVLVAGALAGVALGAAVAAVAGSLWIGDSALTLGVTAIPWVAGVVVVALAAVVVGMASALREPLSEQVRLTDRPRRASVAVLFWHVLVIAGSVVAVYRAGVADAADPDWLVLAGPALVGLAVGQVAVWLVRGLARVSVAWSARRRLPAFLASRRLARVGDGAAALRLLVAATVVCTVSATGAQQVGDWADDTARIRAGAPFQVPVEGDVHTAMGLTRQVDPEGRWLMAAALVPGEGSVPARRAFLETARFDAVLGDFYAGTPAADLAARVGDLAAPQGASIAVGDTATITAEGISSREPGPLRPVVVVEYLDDTGRTAEVTARLDLDASGAPDSVEVPVRRCDAGCQVSGLRLDRSPGDDPVPYLVSGIDFAGVDVLASSWRSTGEGDFGAPGGPIEVDGGLVVVGDQQEQVARPSSQGPRTPILATDSAAWPDGPVEVDDPGGDERAAVVVDRLAALPLVEADGLLADLPLVAAGAPPTVPLAEVMVLAAADTPAPVLGTLGRKTGTEPVTLAGVHDRVAAEAGADQARAYALVAAFCLVVALLVAGAAVARQRAFHQREVAVLRLLGVPLPQVRRSAWLELLALALGAVVAAAAGGWLAVRLLLAHLSLVDVPLHAVPLDIGVRVLPVVVASALAAALVLVVTGRSRRVRSESGRPALLREEGAT